MCSAIAITLALEVPLKKKGNIEWIKAATNKNKKVKLYFQAAQRCWRYVSPTSLGC